MLIRFSVENFLSFEAPVVFTMNASKESQHSRRLAKSRDSAVRILQAAAIYGANASGKSNFTKAVDFARNLVIEGVRPDSPNGRSTFKLREQAQREPSRFEFEIMVNDGDKEKVFRYSFAIDAKSVLEESLIETRAASERVLFSRSCVPEGDASFSLDHWERRGVREEERQFARFIARGTRSNQLFLREAMERNLEALAPVYRWFRDQLVILEPDAEYLPLEVVYEQRPELQGYIAMVLNRADTGVIRLATEVVPIESLGLPSKIKEQIATTIKDSAAGVLLRSLRLRRSVFLHQGELTANRIVTFRRSLDGQKDIAFDTSEESDGTLRLLDLSPVFFDLAAPGARKTYIIDELDRSLHPLLASALIETFLTSRTYETRSQLIFTTHDMHLLDKRLLRRDETWFAQRSERGSSTLWNLAHNKEVRFDRDLRRAYLEGYIGGIPRLHPFQPRNPGGGFPE